MARVSRKLALHVALAAMLLRALLPAGWMPAALNSGSWLQICFGMAATLPVPDRPAMGDMAGMPDMPGMHHSDAPKHDPASILHYMCPFASAAQLAAPGNEFALVAPARLLRRGVSRLGREQMRPVPRLDSAAPRGPPLSV